MACSALITAADWHAHHARSRHRESRARRSRAASGTGRYEESIRRVVNADNTARLRSEELSKGFCNSVHLVRGVNGDDEALVVKLYSDLSLLRTESDQRGAVDKIASVFGLGPTRVVEHARGYRSLVRSRTRLRRGRHAHAIGRRSKPPRDSSLVSIHYKFRASLTRNVNRCCGSGSIECSTR